MSVRPKSEPLAWTTPLPKPGRFEGLLDGVLKRLLG
jgi:hypothetical protein